MSGTSMDGLDIAYASFSQGSDESWSYKLLLSQAFNYPKELLKRLKVSTSLSAIELLILDKDLGQYFGACVLTFLNKHQLSKTDINAIASHGHTVFHQPEKGFTYQIGCGTTLAKITGINVINDFRSKDVVYGGQGAPLVPIGDKLLFSKQADAFLNIGGFSNICIPGLTTIAFDIGPGNLPLNKICTHFFGEEFDRDGNRSKKGIILPSLLESLNEIDFYSQSAPKSLGTEWLEETFMSNISLNDNPNDLLHTITEHIATQIANTIEHYSLKTLLITGGGAKNHFLLERISSKTNVRIIPSTPEIIDFKEAIIFAFLGALYLQGETNTIATVTGAQKSVSSGVLHKA